jgi:hypothetical protein
LSEDIHAVERPIDSAVSGGEAEWPPVVAALTEMPEEEGRLQLERLASTHGVAAVPFLEHLACIQSTMVSISATQALATIRDSSAAAALERVAARTSATEIRKAARRFLHRLASMGVMPTPASTSQPAAVSSKTAAVHMALASPIDGAGNRGIWLAFRRGGELDVVTVLLNDEEGIKDLNVLDISTSRFDREKRQRLEDREFPWIEIPPDYCRHLIGVYHHRNAAAGTPLPVEFLAWREQISVPEARYEQPLAYTVLSAAAIRWEPRYLDNSGDLFDLELFKGWILDEDALRPYVQERMAAERSGLIIAGVSGGEGNRLAEERAIQTLFDARRRALYRERLEEMSYLLWKLGRLEAARLALAAALALEPADRPLSGHPFVRALVQWSLEVVTEMARGEQTKAVKPGVQLLLPY